MITLRQDQDEAVAAVRAAMRSHNSILFQAQTGFGKTIVASYIAKSAMAKATPTIFAVHRRELLEQTSRTFDRFEIPHGIIAAGRHRNRHLPIQIASADTLRQEKHQHRLEACRLFIPDEAHLWAAKRRAAMIDVVREAGAFVIGLTATPERLDGKALDNVFDHMVSGPSVAWLMEQGFLSRYKAFAPPSGGSTDHIHHLGGDYNIHELEDEFDKPKIIGDAITTWMRLANGLRTLVFAVSRKHGAHVTDQYNAAGIPAVYIDGTTPHIIRQARIEKFADGDAKILVSVNLCTEGFDLSAQVGRDVPVEAVQLLRPTESLALSKQMIGRALRPKANPAIILDHVKMLETHGLPDDVIEWSLQGRPKKDKAKSEPTSTCEVCYFTGPVFRECPECGAVKEIQCREIDEVAGTLEEVDVEALRRKRAAEQAQASTMESLVALGRARHYKNPQGWAWNVMKARQGAHTHV